MKKLVLVNNAKQDRREVKVGYSFTTLFFNFLVPLVRGDITGFLVMGGYALLSYIFRLGLGDLPYGLFGIIIFPLIYNRFYIQILKNSGYEIQEESQTEYYRPHMVA